ncbi:hypothetical protein [Dactylosporangium sp. NPDC048998]|uniref:hypothetical protein n=1 Tax=Dactylosporangium sp. NPDC048998 TaxID=3363976 RepID=UPI0037229F01
MRPWLMAGCVQAVEGRDEVLIWVRRSGRAGMPAWTRVGRVDDERGEQLALGLGELGLPEGAGRAGEGEGMWPVGLGADALSGLSGGVLPDADEQQGQPAQQHAGADTLLQPEIGRRSMICFMSRQPRSTSSSCL